MQSPDQILQQQPKYTDLLGKEQALKLLQLFAEINAGKYAKNEIHSFQLKGMAHPMQMRAIRADMQSFVNTFIDPYLEKKSYLQDTKTVIDAGANIGYTAILFANWWPQSRIISIEADQENYELTLNNTAPYKNITVLHAGLWHRAANLRIEAGQEDGFVVREVEGDATSISTQNFTKGISLANIISSYQLGQIDFLKMNIEGSEKEIFAENFEAWLPETKAMLIELHDGKNAGCSKSVFTRTNQYDFAVAETAPYGVLFVKEQLYRTWYANWYREEIYKPNIDKARFPEFYLDQEESKK